MFNHHHTNGPNGLDSHFKFGVTERGTARRYSQSILKLTLVIGIVALFLPRCTEFLL